MNRGIDEVLLEPGAAVRFENRDDLLETLDDLDRRVPGRNGGRTKDHREHFCIQRYLRFMAGEEGLLPLPLTLHETAAGQDPPDFRLELPDGELETFEITDGSTEQYQQTLTEAARRGDRDIVFPEGVDINTPDADAAARWADVLFSAFLRKAQMLEVGRFSIDHLLIYDLTGLQLLVPLEEGAPLLRDRIEQWHRDRQPEHSFRRISILRGLALLFDLTGAARLLDQSSPHFRLSAVQARDEEDLRRRLREIDRYCREHSIRHLKLFGSVLGDLDDGVEEAGDFRRFDTGKSDVDLLVEFEPATRVTLLDMSRMERELGELIGFDVDLVTAEDLSRYFRQRVLDEALELGHEALRA